MKVLWDIQKNALILCRWREVESHEAWYLVYSHTYPCIYLFYYLDEKDTKQVFIWCCHCFWFEGKMSYTKKNKVKKLEEMRSVAAWQIKHLKNFGWNMGHLVCFRLPSKVNFSKNQIEKENKRFSIFFSILSLLN